ncbi:hypothetical protein GCM10008967_14830 [Bacillus carboniphilus]|uniref:Uncharacterized protein n=1 Tax=Bacillus carboniphilus TaxID=86663 RepID=A0ABN0W4Y1_9BACI
MAKFLLDFSIVSILVIGLTAVLGVLTNGLGEKLFGGRNRTKFVDQTSKTQVGWKHVGGDRR